RPDFANTRSQYAASCAYRSRSICPFAYVQKAAAHGANSMISSSASSAGATAAGAGATAAEGVAGAAGASFSGEVAGAEVVALGAPAGGTGVAGARGVATALGADDGSAWDAASAALPLCGTGGFECVRWS